MSAQYLLENVNRTPRAPRISARCDVTVWLNQAEHERRVAEGVNEPVTDWRVLALLTALPFGSPVTWRDLPTEYLPALNAAGSAVEALDGGQVVRVAVPPVDPVIATVYAPRWRSALRGAAQFAGYCARQIVIDEPLADQDLMLFEADYWGVGVCHRDGDGHLVLVVPPAPFIADRYSGASWQFAEHLYGQLLPHLNQH